MKKYYFNYILAAALTLSSCADLEQSSISSIDKDNFYQSKEDIETAINGVYQEFTVDGFYGMFNNQSVYFNDLQTDYVKAGAQTNSAHIRELSNFAIQPTNLFVSYAWEEHYTAINRANVVIDKVTDASFLDEQSKQNYINEARFLRGFTYFNLVRYFGGVPIVLHDGDGEGAPRNTIDEVYHQIVEDFTAAENLPADYTTLDSKANSLAASAILSKVYLTWAQTLTEEGKANQAQFYQKAIQYADKVINSKKYHLLDKFIDIWSVDKKHGPEHIFTIEHDRTINGNDWNIYFAEAVQGNDTQNANGAMRIIICQSQAEKQGYLIYVIIDSKSKVNGTNIYGEAYTDYIEPLLESVTLKESSNVPKIYEEFGLTESEFNQQMDLIKEYKAGNLDALEGTG